MILGITHRVFFLKSFKRLFPVNGRSIVSSMRYKLNLFLLRQQASDFRVFQYVFAITTMFERIYFPYFSFPNSGIENAFCSRHWGSWCWHRYALHIHKVQIWLFSTRLLDVLLNQKRSTLSERGHMSLLTVSRGLRYKTHNKLYTIKVKQSRYRPGVAQRVPGS
jgi:hypothetical protein